MHCYFHHWTVLVNVSLTIIVLLPHPGSRYALCWYQFMLAIMPFSSTTGYLNIHIMPSSWSLVNSTFSPVCWLAMYYFWLLWFTPPPFFGEKKKRERERLILFLSNLHPTWGSNSKSGDQELAPLWFSLFCSQLFLPFLLWFFISLTKQVAPF